MTPLPVEPDALPAYNDRQPSRQRRVASRVRQVVDSTGAGFVYGTIFGGIVATVEGYRQSPQHQRMRGIFHHVKAVLPETAGRIALVTCCFRLASLGMEVVRGHDADLWNVFFAAPIAGAMMKARHGPRAAMQSAVMFASVGSVMVIINELQGKVRHHHESANELLEEIAFAEEVEE
ncbi:hypothetical protein Poli38472_008053 [Pythium oligandrum]|uniref:Uncharacterized protein n=1 Tax=Pythium oligandrum TaxID=41045 RepID=A0A8K1CMK7_PYTOL|nr:hypothetical protein Poli38472_008053 [Pythium oligandrum]|eukprot:TMW65411.1 hypothetical protein Poli38472_008053 [Pythium oligandrum]